ncbi:MAG: LTA synthase family protein [Chitinophagales bacterium]
MSEIFTKSGNLKPSTPPLSYSGFYLSIVKIFFYWLIIFWLQRLCFIIFFQDYFSGQPFSGTAATFVHGFKLDLSAICYVVTIPLFLLMIQQLFRFNFFKVFLYIYSTAVLLVAAFISVFDMGIYRDWHIHVNYRAINYLNFMNEAAAFSDSHEDHQLATIMIVQVVTGFFLLIVFFRKSQFYFPRNKYSVLPGSLSFILIFSLLFLGMRGGRQLIPVDESSAYFTCSKILNDAAMNVTWNAAKKFTDNRESLLKNPYQFMSDSDAKETAEKLYNPKKDSVISVLTTDRPNIVLFVLESFTADVFESLGGENGVTPDLDTVIHHGLLFSNIYSQGYRTDQGLASVFSGWPATPNFSVIMQPEKYHGLSFLPKELADAGYHNSFYYGGELDFANMRAYFLNAGISNAHDKSDYPTSEMNAKWGAHDEFVMKKQASEISKEQQPFFSVILSLSSHEPFQVPMQAKFPGDDIPSKFKSCCYYTDQCIGNYLQSVKDEPWYKNTLFIFVADHGHIYPRNRKFEEPARFHIPIIFYGDVLKAEFRGRQISNVGMQTDLPATILSQLHLSNKDFPWSNDLLNFYRNNFAYYSFDSGIGWVDDHSTLQHYFESNQTSWQDDAFDSIAAEKLSEAFLQKLYGEYITF